MIVRSVNDEAAMKVMIEYTDTFGGEANYAWCSRETITVSSDKGLMRRAKRLMGLSGVRGRTYDRGDLIEFRPYRIATILFVQVIED